MLAEQGVTPETTSEEITAITTAKVDFLGVNYYVPRRVKAREAEYDLDYFTPEVYFENYVNPEVDSTHIATTTKSCRRNLRYR